MAEETDVVEVEATQEEGDGERTKGGILPILAVALVGLAGGGALGAQFLGPAVGPVLAERAASGDEEGGHEGEDEEGEGPAALHVIDNLVVNPARSGGTRFLLTSIAVQVRDPEDTSEVEARDLELRDALIMVLGSKTVEELTEVANRPALIDEIEDALSDILGAGVIRRIYIPQFVIQ